MSEERIANLEAEVGQLRSELNECAALIGRLLGDVYLRTEGDYKPLLVDVTDGAETAKVHFLEALRQRRKP